MPSSTPATSPDPLRHAAPPVDDVEARRARAAVESRLFSGPQRPVRVGRYQIQSRIGAGGMGVVYRAHDPELARDVAVKLMNAELATTKDPVTARARLVREARAMARLAHPNVLHVYDVGTTEDGVFIAMELVEGQSLGSLSSGDDKPQWRALLRYYVDAGRGLAAAHAAGVIHRDFKPENVLVGSDGRVRVGDFGLAGGPAALDRTSSEGSELDRDTGDLHGSGSLTKTGALLGTPKYMAPEQESGGAASDRSDQFSFCVALYEALYGYPPFAGTKVAEYRHNVRHGRVLDPPPDSKVRGWVHAEIVRGLAVDPGDRHPALDPLLDRLEEALVDPNVARRRRRRARVLSVVGGLVALLGVSTLGVVLVHEDDPSATVETMTVAVGPTTPAASTSPTPEIAPLDPIPADDPPSPAPTPPPPALVPVQPAEPEANPPIAEPERPRAVTKRKRNTGTCYFQQDKFNFLGRTRKSTRFITGQDSRCYDCAVEAPDYRRAQLSPSDCARYFLCVGAQEDQCST